MKKILLVLAASAFVMSCKNLADNEFEITGTVDPSLNGKNLFLEKPDPNTGFKAVDTAKVENGKFVFKGTATTPEIYFIGLQDNPSPAKKLQFILENGAIELEMDKDSAAVKSKRSGTYNNDMFTKYLEGTKPMDKEDKAFREKNKDAYMAAFQSQDQATMDKLNNEYKTIKEKREKFDTQFIKDNPKAYINIFLIGQIASAKSPEEAKKLVNSLDPELKKTEKGKELINAFNQAPPAPALPAEAASAPGKSNAEAGSTAPAFSANTPAGKKLSLKEAMGKVTIIDFWASWCGPCRKENPNVVALYKEFHSKGLNIIGVSLDKDADSWKKAITADNLTWNHVSNLKYWDEPIAKQYGVESIPATFILDANGKIVAKNLRGAELKAKIAELLK